MKKRFIEWDLPLKEISAESAREKSIRHGHPSTLHIWWARRPLASSRATNFAALIDLPDDPKKRNEITELIKKISPWEAVEDGNDENIKRARQMIKEQWKNNTPKVLDPFSGGGSIPFETLRLGCETYSNDYNPVAVFIEKATLEWPLKYGVLISNPNRKTGIDGEINKINFLIYMFKKWAKIVFEQVTQETCHFYPREQDGSIPIGYIWTRTITCQNPNCGAEIPLVGQFWLANKENIKVAYKPIINKEKKTIEFEIIKGEMGGFDPQERTVNRADVRCLVCEQITKANLTRRLASQGKMGQRLAVVILNNPSENGKKYRIATENDLEIYNKSENFLKEKINNWTWLDSPIPDEKIAPIGTYGIDAQRYTVNQEWGELFNSRQKAVILTILEKIQKNQDKIKKDCISLSLDNYEIDTDDATKAIIGYLGILLDRIIDSYSKQNVWIPVGEKPAGTFGRQALPVVWDYLENNILEGSARAWENQIDWLVEFIDFASKSFNNLEKKNVFITNFSATNIKLPDNTFDAVFTDPPYYDNVPYSDLSDFFYVWLKRSVGDYFSDLFSTPLTPKSEEAIAEPMRQKNPDKFFENMISQSFKEIHRILKPNGIATIVYAHKTTTAWETMLNSLVNAGLVVTASWPLHTERSGRLRGQGSAALASSIYMVCRKIDRKKVGFYSEIQPQIKQRIEEKLQQFWDEGIAGGDFFISAIGPGMEIFSQYERVEKLSGEQVTTSELLDYIRSASTDFIVGKLLKNASSANIDRESDFYLAYRWTYQDNIVEYDDARKLASASGISLEDLWGPAGFVKKNGSTICVLGPKERSDIESIKNMVDVMHKTLLLWKKGKKDEIAELLAKTGFGNNPAFKQFCQAVAESLKNGNKEKQLLEGFLLGIDTYARAEVKTQKFQTDLKQYGVR